MAEKRHPERAVAVTGGSSGIGAAFCRAAARHGWHVWIGYGGGADRAARLAAEITASRGSAAPIALPLDDIERLHAGVATMTARAPLPQAVVLCGAPAPDVLSLLKLTPGHFRYQFECATVGNHALIAQLWRRCFRPGGGGHVIAVLSAALGSAAASHMGSYVAAKGALEALLHAAAAELGRAGLRVSVVRPGYVETPMLGAFQPLFLERARAAAQGQRFLDPRDVASAMLRSLLNPPQPGAVCEVPLAAAGAAVS